MNITKWKVQTYQKSLSFYLKFIHILWIANKTCAKAYSQTY